MILNGILDWEIVPGYPLKSFDWILAIYILGVAILAFVLFYFIYVFIFTKNKMSKDEEKEANEQIAKINKLNKQEKKDSIKKLDKKTKRLRNWKIMKLPLSITCGVCIALSCIAAPVLSTTWEALMQALNKKTGGNNDSEAARLAIGESKENVVTLEKEGAVLLRNNNDVLPLNKETNNKVNIFGSSAFGMLYGGGGSGVFVTNSNYNGNDFHATRFEKAMLDEGFEYNMDIYNLVANYYDKKTYSINESNYDISCQYNAFQGNTYDKNGNLLIAPTKFPYDNEPEVKAYTQTYPSLNGKTLLDSAKEYSDVAIYAISRAGSEDTDLNHNLCKLTSREADMINFLAENFDKVIILINSSNPMELKLLDQEGIDSVLWIGHPGLTGNKAVAKIISGEYNPSGKMADTWAYDITSAPSFQSFGPDTTKSSSSLGKSIVEYREGIYVGYRYYTTRAYEDDTFNYDDYVQYSFGEGYSYTTFEKHISEYEFDEETNKLSVQVAVKNTGDVAGKEVVELYLTAPYNKGGIEKAYVELAGYAKTNELKPNETYYARIDIDLEDLASWDTNNGNYVLEKGTYVLSLRDDCNTLTKVTGSNKNTITFEYKNDVRFLKGDGGTNYKNQFSDCEYGPHQDKIQYMTRSDFAGTFPKTSDINTNDISDNAKNALKNKSYNTDQTLTGNTDLNQKNGLTLRDLKGADYDDPRWEQLLAQLSKQELIDLVDNGGFQTIKIDSISKRLTYDDDGPASIQVKGTGYVGEVVIASTWNLDAAKLMGESIGKEGAAMGLTGWYAPGLNIHRCATGGRNFEYYSEDPMLSGSMGGYVAKGTAKYGVFTYAKHIALNDQETERQNLTVWANEQSIRQIYLRPFEIYVKEGGLGFMSSFSRIGSVWSGAHGFLNSVCRDEWGFKGVVITDWINPNLMPVNMGIRGGNDLWLLKNTISGASKLANETPNDAIILLKNAAHHILYACANSNCVWTEEEYHELGVNVDFSQMGYDNI